MNKNTFAFSFLSIMILVSGWAGYQTGMSEKKIVYDNLMFLIYSDRNIQAITGIKTLEHLETNDKNTTIEVIQKRVKFFLTVDGVEQETIDKAISYQQKHCNDSCLGV